ncbi:MAG TPA: cytochrome c1 [Caulobacteraceae bacterium]|nr:cytochrome c1 [Caulobacteraceae bacterium]
MLRKFLAILGVAGLCVAAPALAATTQAPLRPVHWSFEGPFGQYDQAQLQRGFKIYREVCSQCHSMNLIAFHNLGDPGGPFWDPRYPNSNSNPVVKAIASAYKVSDIDADTGDQIKRTATTADYLPPPFPNDPAARASNGGALPPDMSLLAAARDGGPRYIYNLVTGFPAAPPAGLTVPPGKYYNPYFAGDLTSSWHGDPAKVPVGGILGMPPPLVAGKVTFDDGTPSTLDQEGRDVAAFLQWASDPKMDQRKQTGVAVLIYLVVFSGLLYASYRRIWRNIAH